MELNIYEKVELILTLDIEEAEVIQKVLAKNDLAIKERLVKKDYIVFSHLEDYLKNHLEDIGAETQERA